jgi:hypothetical protein
MKNYFRSSKHVGKLNFMHKSRFCYMSGFRFKTDLFRSTYKILNCFSGVDITFSLFLRYCIC